MAGLGAVGAEPDNGLEPHELGGRAVVALLGGGLHAAEAGVGDISRQEIKRVGELLDLLSPAGESGA